MNLAKLALNFSATRNLVDLTVVSMSSIEIIKENLKSLVPNEISSFEKRVLEHIKNK